MDKFTAAANVSFFLQEKTGSVCGKWKGKLSAKEQRELFGMFLGKGMLYIDGAKETIEHIVKAGFGGDYEATFIGTFNTIEDSAVARCVAYDVAVSRIGFVPTWDSAKAYTVGY